MYKIHLHGLIFHAHHGLYAEETVTGNRFEVSVDIGFSEKMSIQSLDDSIDYVKVYDCISEHMKKPEALLEVLASNLASAIHTLYPRIAYISIHIFKTAAPIKGFSGKVGVSFDKQYAS